MKVILIAGKKTHGKSTLAGHIEHILQLRGEAPDVKRLSFATALKQMAIDWFGLTRQQCYGSDNDKNTPTDWKWSDLSPDLRGKYQPIEATFLTNGNPDAYITARQFLQLFGTDIFRNNFGKDVWVKVLYSTIKNNYSDYDYIIIDDARFPNEVQKLEGFDTTRILIRRPVESKDTHESERALDGLPDIYFDFIVENDKTEQDLALKASKIAESIAMR